MKTHYSHPRHACPARVMLSRLAFAACLCVGASASAEIYRATQPDGTVVFTDRPVEDAVVVEPVPTGVASSASRPIGVAAGDSFGESAGTSAASSTDAASRPNGSAFTDTDRSTFPTATGSTFEPIAPLTVGTTADTGDTPAATAVERVEIASPLPDATLIDPTGPLVVEVGTAPGSLATSGLVAEVLLDGNVVARGMTEVAVPRLERGTHRLAVQLLDPAGNVVVVSEEQPLHVRRTFVRPDGDVDN